MITCKVLFRTQNRKMYRLEDSNGKIVDMSAENLKEGIRKGELKVLNITMGTDGRIRLKNNTEGTSVDERKEKAETAKKGAESKSVIPNTSGLTPYVTLTCNNKDCVILEVKKGHRMDLIRLGCFNGDEEMFRLTKGETVTCTVFRKDCKPFSWSWGSRSTLVSDEVTKMGRIIEKCVVKDFGIQVRFW